MLDTKLLIEGTIMNIKKIIMHLLVIILLFICSISYAENIKTIIIVTDELDFSTIEKLDFKSGVSLGLMNTRTSNVFKRNSESYFMTIATGRRVQVEKELFKGLSIDKNGNIVVDGYKNIIKNLDKNYKGFSNNMDFLADSLKEKHISIGYIGNDESSLIAADRNGIIYSGYLDIQYNKDWLVEKTSDVLEESDVLVVSFQIEDKEERIEILKNYIDEFSMDNILIFPSSVTGDVQDIRNSTLVPIIYCSQMKKSGILTSNSTKRQGLVTNMDIFSEITSIYGIKTHTTTGHKMYAQTDTNDIQELIDRNIDNLHGIMNMLIIKYIFHGVIITIQLYIIYDILKKKKNTLRKFYMLMNGLLIMIFVSMALGIFKLSQSIILYSLVLTLITILITYILDKKGVDALSIFPILTNIIILFAVFFCPDMIYNSFYGFNNVISGGRFYGLNNESMAVLITTGIIAFYQVKRKVNNRILSTIDLCIYFPIIIMALSEKYATNFGGYITSIIAFLMLLYITLFKRKLSKKTMFTLFGLGIGIFLIGFAIKTGNASNGHAKSLYIRIGSLGLYELFDMIKKKVKQLVLMAISPPWSIILIGQLCFIKRFLLDDNSTVKKAKIRDPYILEEIMIIFITSICAFMLNDTGVIAFTYMNTYVVAKLLSMFFI